MLLLNIHAVDTIKNVQNLYHITQSCYFVDNMVHATFIIFLLINRVCIGMSVCACVHVCVGGGDGVSAAACMCHNDVCYT